MEFKFKKHVSVICNLAIGEQVIIEGWGREFDFKTVTIEDIKFNPGISGSGVQVKVSGYNNYIDSDWITKTTI